MTHGGQVNKAHIAAFLELTNNAPAFRSMSMAVCDIGPGFSRVEIRLEEKHHNPSGRVHGGVYAFIIDTAAYFAVYCDVPEDAGYISLDLKVDNLGSIRDGLLIAEGKLIKAGRTICMAEAVLRNSDGRLLAHGTSKLLVTQGLQTVKEIVIARGSRPLPPKYIL